MEIRYDIVVNGEVLHKYIKQSVADSLKDWYQKAGKIVELKIVK